MLINIPRGTQFRLNGIPVTSLEQCSVDFPCDSIDTVAELCSAAQLHIDLSHIDGDKQVRYGAAGKRYESEIEPVYEEPKPKTEGKNYRSEETGKFVDIEVAEDKPDETVAEPRKRKKKGE